MPPKDDKTQAGDVPSLEGLTKAFGDMSKAFSSLPAQVSKAVEQGINNAVAQQNAAQQRQQKTQTQPKGDAPAKPAVTAADVEKMSRAQFAEHIIGIVSTGLAEKLKPFEDSISSLTEMTQRERLGGLFAAAKQKHPDFDQWKDEMAEVVQEHGYLDPEKLYILARASNPDKAKQIDEEANKAKQETEKASKGSDEKPRFLGLMPTNNGAEKGEDTHQYKTVNDAANAAFDEIMADIPASFLGENSPS